jgi:hypothetical protein
MHNSRILGNAESPAKRSSTDSTKMLAKCRKDGIEMIANGVKNET